MTFWLLLALSSPLLPTAHASPESAAFQPTSELDLDGLMALVEPRSPVLQAEHLAVEIRQAELRQSRLLDNPVLDLAVGTLPIGPANPPDLPSPLSNIPNYSAGLSLHPDLARRSARIERGQHLLAAAAAQRRYAIRGQALRLLRILGDLAVSTLRLTADLRLVGQARASLGLARDRVRTGFGPPLDADRAEIELLRLEQQVSADRGDILLAQASCAEILGTPCNAFAEEPDARRFLSRWITQAESEVLAIESRPDLQAMAAQARAAAAEQRLARAGQIPDPTVRVGYVYDSFVFSGNQQHSLNVSLSLPLALSDRGQAAAQSAAAQSHRMQEQRRLMVLSSMARAESLQRAAVMQRQRLTVLQQQVLPRGQSILRDVRRAFEARAVPLTDLNQAQRALDELLLQEATALGDLFRLCVDLLELSGAHAQSRS
ncbi:MAG: TolC family protein [Myxococcales bacterium]|nr:TolC family protein [Myxococcales bacterium]